MSVQLYDKTQLDALLSLGGAELRDQFLADLQRCQQQLRHSIARTADDEKGGLAQARHGLHEMRGIALTVGATPLIRLCAESEAFCDIGRVSEVTARHSEILMICSDMVTQITADSAGVS